MQIKFPSYFLFALASFLLVLHNVTPHFHYGEISQNNSSEQHYIAKSLVDYLLESFQHDPGAGHLECFSEHSPLDQGTGSEQFLIIDFIQLDFLWNAIQKVEFTLSPEGYVGIKEIPIPLILSSPLRAPPVIT